MVFAWICIIGGLAIVVGGIVAVTKGGRDTYDRNMYVGWGIAAIVAGLLLSIGTAYWLYGTEAGARALKSFQSTTGGGLTRVVSVYDMEGDLLNEYEGKFDVDANEKRVLFDMPQPDGTYKRVQIWSATGTITIEEK